MGRRFAYRGETGIAQANRAAKNHKITADNQRYRIRELENQRDQVNEDIQKIVSSIKILHPGNTDMALIAIELKKIIDNNNK